ncbi:hypothetical protein GCM10027419_37270 [Pandoraea terrae]
MTAVCLASVAAVAKGAGPGGAAPDAAPSVAAVAADGVQHITIVGGDYYFRPEHVVVKVNTPVALTVSVERGIIPHRFVLKIPGSDVSIDESLGQEPTTFAFTPKAAGKYPFYCPNRLLFFKSHRERGMEGVLEVVE